MKRFLIISFFFIQINTYSQSPSDLFNTGKYISQNAARDKIPKRWFSNTEIEFSVSNEVRYDYALLDNNGKLLTGRSTDLENKSSFGALYSINYPVFNKLSVGAVGGFQHQFQQSISALKVGGIIRYHFTNYESVNINLMTAYNVALSNNIESDMANVRLGLQFPITRGDDFSVNLNVFGDYNHYVIAEAVLGETNERPANMIFRSYGISLGFLF